MKQKTDTDRPKQFTRRTLILSMVATAILVGLLMTGIGLRFVGRDGLSILQAQRLIETKFVGETEQSADVTLSDMVSGLHDRWSYYLPPDSYEWEKEMRDNAYVGIGVTVALEEDGMRIIEVKENSPAASGGILVNEVIRVINGTKIDKENGTDCMKQMRGKAETRVSLEVEDAAGVLRTVEVVRSTLVIDSVASEMLEGDIGLVRIKNFYSGSADTLKEAVNGLQANGAVGLMFDVRNNPGGYVTEVTAMLDFLLPEGNVFISRDIEGKEQIFTSDAACIDLPIAVLVNGESYSAAELFAAELREGGNAVIVGEQTSGKGYAQQTFPLANGGALGLSTLKYFTGSGVSLIGTGLLPNPMVSLTEDEHWLLRMDQLSHAEDRQLQAARASLGA